MPCRDSIARSIPLQILSVACLLAIGAVPASGGDPIRYQTHSIYVRALRFSKDGEVLTSVGVAQVVKWWDVKTQKCLKTVTAETKKYPLAQRGDLAFFGENDVIEVRDRTTNELKHKLHGHSVMTKTARLSPDGKYLASGDREGTIRLWDVSKGEEIGVLKGHKDTVGCLAFHPRDRLLASGAWPHDRRVVIWNLETLKIKQVIDGHQDGIHSVVFSPDGKTLVSTSGDEARGEIRLWNMETGDHRLLRKEHIAVTAVAYSPDGERLATGSLDGSVTLWATSRFFESTDVKSTKVATMPTRSTTHTQHRQNQRRERKRLRR